MSTATVNLKKVRLVSGLREAQVNDKAREVEVTVISEGLGNLRDMHYYTMTALESMPALFEGAKIYADHPSKTEESDRPERSVRDIIGNHTNVRVMQEGGHGVVKSTVKIFDGPAFDWAWTLIKEAVTYANKHEGKDLVGVSINADGETREQDIDEFLSEYDFPGDAAVRQKVEQARDEGKKTVYAVAKITDVVSADMVTEAGAGGAFSRLMESAKGGLTMKNPKAKAFLESLLGFITGGKTKEAQAEVEAALRMAKEAEDDTANDDDMMKAEEARMTQAATEMAEATEGEDETESERRSMAAYGRYIKGGGEMKYAEFESEMGKRQTEAKQTKDAEQGSTEAKRENAAMRRELASIKADLAKRDYESSVAVLIEASGLPATVAEQMKPVLLRAKDLKEAKAIIGEWRQTFKAVQDGTEIEVDMVPAKGGHLSEANHNSLFTGCLTGR